MIRKKRPSSPPTGPPVHIYIFFPPLKTYLFSLHQNDRKPIFDVCARGQGVPVAHSMSLHGLLSAFHFCTSSAFLQVPRLNKSK